MNSSFWSIFSQREAILGTFDNVSISRDPPEGSCSLVEEVVGGLVGLIVCLVGVVVVVRRNMEAVQNILGQIQNLLTTLTSATRQIFQSHEMPPPLPPRHEFVHGSNLTDDHRVCIELSTSRISRQSPEGVQHLYAVVNNGADISYV